MMLRVAAAPWPLEMKFRSWLPILNPGANQNWISLSKVKAKYPKFGLNFNQKEKSKLQTKVSVYSAENAYHEEAVRVLQEQLNAAKSLLHKHGIAFEAPIVNVMKLVDPFVLEATIEELKASLTKMQTELDTKSYEVRVLSLKVKTQKSEHKDICGEYDRQLEKLRVELAALKVGCGHLPYCRIILKGL
jgi:hypothetical protein